MSERRQVVRFAFYKLDPAWRRLSAERQANSQVEFGETIEGFHGQLLLRPYGLVGIRGDCDFLLWQVAEDLDGLVALQTALNRTDLGEKKEKARITRKDQKRWASKHPSDY